MYNLFAKSKKTYNMRYIQYAIYFKLLKRIKPITMILLKFELHLDLQ